MTRSNEAVEVYLEVGSKRVVAGAIEWPGWCRIGRDEESALQSLLDYGPRYSRVLDRSSLGFSPPDRREALAVVERLAGDASTDFGVAGAAPAADSRPVGDAELTRLEEILSGIWRTFDEVVAKAEGKELRRGPRGGGRDVAKIIEHVLGGDRGYLRQLAWRLDLGEVEDPSERLDRTRRGILDALRAASRGETPTRGPRGGKLWSPRYFVRRVAWHTLDHAWEIEDREV